VADVAGAIAAAGEIGYPVVLKVDHPTLSHKSDVGGVRIGLMNADAVTAAATGLLSLAPGAALLVQPMSAGVEISVGGLREATFGPVVAVGLGGVLVEILNDVSFAVAPITPAEAERLIWALRSAGILKGVRGALPSDVGALATLLCRVGDLMTTYPELLELDLNPVLAGHLGCAAVDFRVVVEQSYSR